MEVRSKDWFVEVSGHLKWEILSHQGKLDKNSIY